MTSLYEDALYEDPMLARFYDLDNSLQRADYAVYLNRASSAQHILDLGCGTGTLLTAIAEQYPHTTLVGVDPAQAMLDIAQQKTSRVRWLSSTAEKLNLDMKFDLIILSGHAFQVFLTQEQRISALQAMQRHLTADGSIVFDSRNPAVEEWREWTPELSRESLTTQEFGEVTLWNDVAELNGIVRYQTFYQQGENGPIFRAESDIAFPTLSDIAQAVEFCGLRVRYLYGDWQLNAFQENSPEMVFTLEHASPSSVNS
ncbi:Cypemycin N-terminal methyltransferase [Providencia alcalifaciens]|uniref:class I SAM-dependent methyltransferase n=1 Tax=Providencia alcalifaciens TaxID=126385 RepID=UPI000448D02F|nr:class I SAM-dependent methyltransferase [Providencia alcalifaciens]EUD01847.1 methyltransferase domain protein [Providencia alcalifaciens RIMD 1656011]CAG9432171.1 Cypemycin N-terminal methyltransferase [Providencia alcalifaciens]